mgnify:CR=1 FL=1
MYSSIAFWIDPYGSYFQQACQPDCGNYPAAGKLIMLFSVKNRIDRGNSSRKKGTKKELSVNS